MTKTPTALDALRAHYTKLDAARSAVQDLEALIAHQQAEAAEAQESVPSFGELYRKREDLLAAVVAGEPRDKELKALDETIAKEEASARELRAKAERRAADAHQAIAGLSRKLERVRAELEALEENTPALVEACLLAEAETACAAYVEAALKVRATYLRLVALDRILRNWFKSKRTIVSPEWGRLVLPTFNLPPCEGLDRPNWPGLLFSARLEGHSDTFERSQVEERARLEKLGVRFG